MDRCDDRHSLARASDRPRAAGRNRTQTFPRTLKPAPSRPSLAHAHLQHLKNRCLESVRRWGSHQNNTLTLLIIEISPRMSWERNRGVKSDPFFLTLEDLVWRRLFYSPHYFLLQSWINVRVHLWKFSVLDFGELSLMSQKTGKKISWKLSSVAAASLPAMPGIRVQKSESFLRSCQIFLCIDIPRRDGPSQNCHIFNDKKLFVKKKKYIF